MHRLRDFNRGGRLLLALAVGGAIFGIASAVQADIPDSGVIHACYSKSTRSLYVIDSDLGQHCNAATEAALNWNQTGPTGKRGPTGPKGATGVTGPTGPSSTSHAYGNSETAITYIITGPSVFPTTIVSKTVPPGNYVASASAIVTRQDNDTSEIADCKLDPSTSPTIATSVEGDLDSVMSIVGLVSLPSGGTISLDCSSPATSAGHGPSVSNATIVASKVDALN